jgi:dephospho-CoA kinase
MKIIGLTGKACTGKNVVAKKFEDKGYYVIDVDKLGHRALEENITLIADTFGNVLDSDGNVDRKKLGNIVFGSKEKLKILEGITHPGIKKIIIDLIEKESNDRRRDIIINAALLERGKLDELCDCFIYVKSHFLVRYSRTKKRDKRKFWWFFKRNLSQRHIRISNIKRKKAVYIINNNKGIDEICRQVDNICDILKERRYI